MMYAYITNEKTVVPTNDIAEAWELSEGNKVIKLEEYRGYKVSTSFLPIGLEPRELPSGEIQSKHFETMVFPVMVIDYSLKALTLEEALENHRTALQYLDTLPINTQPDADEGIGLEWLAQR